MRFSTKSALIIRPDALICGHLRVSVHNTMGVPLSTNKPACCHWLKMYKTAAMTPDDSGDDAFIIRDPSGLTGGLSPRHSLDKRGQEIELIRCYRNAIYARLIWFGRAEDPISRWTRARVSLSDHPYRWFFSRPAGQPSIPINWFMKSCHAMGRESARYDRGKRGGRYNESLITRIP